MWRMAVGLGRRKIGLEQTASWVFNRMADVYDARPPYPDTLVRALVSLAGTGHVADVGAGIGHFALPLAAHGCKVTAVEPALAMLERLRNAASARDLDVNGLHAAAEALPIADGSIDLALVSDALHFLDAERAGSEIGRVLRPGGALAVVICEPADTAFMRAVVQAMSEAAPRRPRAITPNLVQLAAVAGVPLTDELCVQDETRVDPPQLERILRSISYIGPAMNPERFAAFSARIHALSAKPVWARRFVLHTGRKR